MRMILLHGHSARESFVISFKMPVAEFYLVKLLHRYSILKMGIFTKTAILAIFEPLVLDE